MRKAVLALLTTTALAVGSVLPLATAEAAAKPAYKVTLKTSVASSVAERFITVSGKVAGPKAAGRNVIIQRQYGGGGWATVATAKIRANGTYAARVETPKGGTTAFRAYKAASSVRKAGLSAAKAIPVFRWINLATQTSLHDADDVIVGVEETYLGKTRQSINAFGDGYAQFKISGQCTQLTSVVDYQDDGATQSVDVVWRQQYIGGGSTGSGIVLTKGTPKTMTMDLVQARTLALEVSNFDSGYKLLVFEPKVWCNADVLPAWTWDDLK